MIDTIKSIACAAWSFIKSSAADKTKESAAKHYNNARKSINLQRLTYERGVRDTILRATPSLSEKGQKELLGFIRAMHKIQGLLPDEECLVMPSVRQNSVLLRVNHSHEIQIMPQQAGDKNNEQTSWQVTLRRPNFVAIEVEVCQEAFRNYSEFYGPSVVFSPAGLVPYINTWIHGISDNYHSTNLSFSQIEDSFCPWPARSLHKKRQWLSKNSVGIFFKDRLEDWSCSEILLDAPPSVLSAIINNHVREGGEKIQQLDDFLAKGLAEISTFHPEVFGDAVCKSATKARAFEENLEIVAYYLQPKVTNEDYSIDARLNVTPVPPGPLCNYFIKVTDWHGTHLTSILEDQQYDKGNYFRVFAQVAGSPIPDIVVRNNVAWAKNEILTLLDRKENDWMAEAAETGCDYISINLSFLAESLEKTCSCSGIEALGIEPDDSPHDYCMKILQKTASNIYDKYLAEKTALSSLVEDITGQKTPEHSALECS